MKNLFLLLGVAAVLVAGCNSESDTSTPSLLNDGISDRHIQQHQAQPPQAPPQQAENERIPADMIQNQNAAGADAQAKFAVMTFEKPTYDFGSIKQGEKIEHKFKFTNTGETDLIITNAQAGCGCTVPEFPRNPIKPGESGEIPVIFDSKTRSNNVTSTITITANTNPNINTLTVQGFVETN